MYDSSSFGPNYHLTKTAHIDEDDIHVCLECTNKWTLTIDLVIVSKTEKHGKER